MSISLWGKYLPRGSIIMARRTENTTSAKNGLVNERLAHIAFIGEALGSSFDLLNKMMDAIGFKHEDSVFLELDEREILEKKIRSLNPRLIVTLGPSASNQLLGDAQVGKPVELKNVRGVKRSYLGIDWICTYHPQYLVENPLAKKEAWEDFQAIAKTLGIQIPTRNSKK